MTQKQIKLMKLKDHPHHWSYFADSPEDVSADNSVDVVEEYYEAMHPGTGEALASRRHREKCDTKLTASPAPIKLELDAIEFEDRPITLWNVLGSDTGELTSRRQT